MLCLLLYYFICMFVSVFACTVSPGDPDNDVAITITPSWFPHLNVPTCPQSSTHGNNTAIPAISAHTHTHYRYSDLHRRWPGFRGDSHVRLSRFENYLTTRRGTSRGKVQRCQRGMTGKIRGNRWELGVRLRRTKGKWKNVKWSEDFFFKRRKCASVWLIGKNRAATEAGWEVLFLLGQRIVRKSLV